jgi:hypothetical protein
MDLDRLRDLQHVADTARRWQTKRDLMIQVAYRQGDASLSELAEAAGISKQRAHQIVRGPCVAFPPDRPPNRVQVPGNPVKKTRRQREVSEAEAAQLRAAFEARWAAEDAKLTERQRARRRARFQAEVKTSSPSQEQIDKMNVLLADIRRRIPVS